MIDDFEQMEADEEADEEEEEVEILGGEGMTPEEVAQAEAKWDVVTGNASGGRSEGMRVKVLPLYGILPKNKQDRVFGQVADG